MTAETTAIGSSYAPASIVLSAGQAAGTSPVLPANTGRKALMINPPSDCSLTVSPGSTSGWPLVGRAANSASGEDCPTNALYVYGLVAGQTLTIWEA